MRLAVAGATGLIGSQLVRRGRADGHTIVELSKSVGVDLLNPIDLDHRLAGVDVIIDTTRPPTIDQQEATTFYQQISANLGAAAIRAGVSRAVVLSIIGADRAPDYPWYAATLAHEQAAHEHYPGPRVLRTTQFHEFPGQILERSRDGGRAFIMDVPIQPVDSAQVATNLLEMATERTGPDQELAGPQVEQLVDLVHHLATHEPEPLLIQATPAHHAMAAGSMLPQPTAQLRGPDWSTWHRRQAHRTERQQD